MNTEVHICPMLMRTVIWENGECCEDCSEECPISASTTELKTIGKESKPL